MSPRPLAATPTAAPPLPADLIVGLKRLKLATVRRLAPEVLATAKVQRWTPEEVLRTLVEAEIAARQDTNTRTRRRAAGFPVVKTLEAFQVTASSVPQATLDYLAALDWIAARENVVMIGPAGTGKSHVLVALGHAAVDTGLRVRYLTAADLVEQLYRGLADNSVGRVIDLLLRNDFVIIDEVGFAPLDDTGTQLLFRFVAAAYERRALGVGSHWPLNRGDGFSPNTSPPPACWTGCCTTPPSSSPTVTATACAKPAPAPEAAVANPPPRDANVTPVGCVACGQPLPAGRRRTYCSPACRQAGYRRRRAAPRPVAWLPPKRSRREGTVYACPDCDERYLEQQWCDSCNRPCRRLGPGGPCPHCQEVITITDITEVTTTTS